MKGKFARIAIAVQTCVLAASSATAQSPQRFDLICAISSETDSQQREVRYSVDLDRSQWCGPRCEAPQAIASVAPDKLVLRNMGPIGEDPRDRNDRHTITVKRADGSYESVFVMRTAGLFEVDRGTCRVAEFTAFPATLF